MPWTSSCVLSKDLNIEWYNESCERRAGGCWFKEGNKGAVRKSKVSRFVRMIGADTKGETRASRYSSAGRIAPSSSEISFLCIEPSMVVSTLCFAP